MSYSSSNTDIVVHILPTVIRSEQSENPIRSYEAFVYTALPVNIGYSASRKVANEYNGLPLRGAGRLAIPWRHYQDYLGAFQDGEKGVETMRAWMRETLAEGLGDLVDQLRVLAKSCKVWWTSEAPELEDMPWEFLFERGGAVNSDNLGLLFVRGRPPRSPPPVLPLVGPLRLLCCNGAQTPNWLTKLFETSNFPGIVPIQHDGSLHEAASRAVNEGIELMHICADGRISSAYEGILYCNSNRQPEITTHELSSLLRGSRVSVIALTEQEPLSPEIMRAHGRDIVSVYRAFACFSISRSRLPSMIAPIGPSSEITAREFWHHFYSALARTYYLDDAIRHAREMVPFSTYALFLRHGPGKLFRIASADSLPMPAPEKMAVDLVSSIAAVKKAHTLNEIYGDLPEYLTDFVQEEGVRQKRIREELSPWTEPEGESNEPGISV